MSAGDDLAAYWNGAYADGGMDRSWYQLAPVLSLAMLTAVGADIGDSLIDVGGGASTLVDAVLDRGFRDVTVLDVSDEAMRVAQARIGSKEGRIAWICGDLLAWRPARRYRIWHDRAVFHFLTTGESRERYLQVLGAATAPESVAIFGCFALDGPQSCSGLPTARYDAGGLGHVIGAEWELITQDEEDHVSPAGAVQPFTWAAFRRRQDESL